MEVGGKSIVMKATEVVALIYTKKSYRTGIAKKLTKGESENIKFFKFGLMKIQIINGPNLNLLGVREKSIYGDSDFESFLERLKKAYPQVTIEYFQSNSEGALIDKLHEVGFSYDGIIFNAGGYTHTSIAIADAIASITTAVVEVHISNVHAREEYRHVSRMAKNCKGVIAGFGLQSYLLALESFLG